MNARMVIGIAAVLLMGASAGATVVVDETFTHLAGGLVGQAPETGGVWAAHSGAALQPVQVVSGGLGGTNAAQLVQGAGGREDVNTAFANGEVAGAGEKFYASFWVNVSGAEPAGALYFAHFLQANSTNFTARMGVTDAAGGFSFALFSTATTMDTVYPQTYAFGTWHQVVTSYDFDSGLSWMWVDPVGGLGENDPAQVTGITSVVANLTTPVSSYAFRQSTPPVNSQDTTQIVDNLIVATTFAEVVTPEPATLSLLALGGLALLRRRR